MREPAIRQPRTDTIARPPMWPGVSGVSMERKMASRFESCCMAGSFRVHAGGAGHGAWDAENACDVSDNISFPKGVNLISSKNWSIGNFRVSISGRGIEIVPPRGETDGSAEEVVAEIMRSVRAHGGSMPQADDITIVLARRSR